MAPNLLALLEDLPVELGKVNWDLSQEKISDQIERLVANLQLQRPWLTRAGQPLVPPFGLETASAAKTVDRFEWPPRGWTHLQTLSLVVQGAHLMLVLLLTAGRDGEVQALAPDCVQIMSNGKHAVRGHTYKLSSSLFGEERNWPAPPLLVQCLGQQARLAKAWAVLPESFRKGLPKTPRFDADRLWISIRAKGAGDAEFYSNNALQALAGRVGVTKRPGGKQVHAHRFRKTTARLAGVALWNSPLVLRRIFGHRSIEMTLHYILSDPQIREEAEVVLRELRVMHAAETLEEIHAALARGVPPPTHGGEGGKRIIDAVISESQRLAADGRLWDRGSAYDLATLLTINGTGWRLVRENVVCAKAPGEPGACKSERRGQPNVAGCKPECVQRIQLASGKRDTEATIMQYIDIADQAHSDGQVLVMIGAFEGLQSQITQFPDLESKYAEQFSRLKHRVDLAQAEGA